MVVIQLGIDNDDKPDGYNAHHVASAPLALISTDFLIDQGWSISEDHSCMFHRRLKGCFPTDQAESFVLPASGGLLDFQAGERE